MKLLGVVKQAYHPVHDFWESRRTNYFISGVLVSVFVLCMVIALINYLGWLPVGGLLGRVHFLQAVEISFTLLLFFETISLVFVIPQSIANSIGKQIEILSLVLLRSSFKEFSHYNFQLPLQSQLEPVYKMVSDGIGALLIFLLLSTYYGVQRHRSITEVGRPGAVRGLEAVYRATGAGRFARTLWLRPIAHAAQWRLGADGRSVLPDSHFCRLVIYARHVSLHAALPRHFSLFGLRAGHGFHPVFAARPGILQCLAELIFGAVRHSAVCFHNLFTDDRLM